MFEFTLFYKYLNENLIFIKKLFFLIYLNQQSYSTIYDIEYNSKEN